MRLTDTFQFNHHEIAMPMITTLYCIVQATQGITKAIEVHLNPLPPNALQSIDNLQALIRGQPDQSEQEDASDTKIPQDPSREKDKDSPIIDIPQHPDNVGIFDKPPNHPPGCPSTACISQYDKPEEFQPSQCNIRYQAINIISFVTTIELMLTCKLPT